MSTANLQRRIMMRNNITCEDLLSISTYKKDPKKLYKQLVVLKEKSVTPTGKRRSRELIDEFLVVRSPELYPELWI